MKFILILLFTTCLFGQSITNKHRAVIARMNVAVGGPTVVKKDSLVQATGTTLRIGRFGNDQYLETKLLTTSAYTITRVDLRMVVLAGTISSTDSLQAFIYSDLGDSANVQIGTASDWIAESTVGATDTWITFPNMNVRIEDATVYHVVINRNTTDGTNYTGWNRGTYNVARYMRLSSSGAVTTWGLGTNGWGVFRIWGY